jgi:DNA polymerase elongation subunit (family B)
MGCIKKIHYAVLYDKYDYVFNDFVDFFTELRKKNTACNVFGKLIINSLYGRLGMGDNDEITFFYKKDEIDSISNYIKIKQIKELNDFAIITAEKNKFLYSIVKFNNEKNKSNIAIAAAITSKARIKLHNAFEDVIKNNGSLLYSDTDSVFASYKKNIINEQHGELL